MNVMRVMCMKRCQESMRSAARALLALALSYLPLSAAAAPVINTEEMSLAVGENRTIPATEVQSFSNAADAIAEVKVPANGAQLVIVGRKPGTSTLLLLMKDGREVVWKINVFAQPVQVVESELTELLGDAPGIGVRRVGPRFFIEGGVTTEPELDRIKHIADLYKGQVESLVVLGGVAADRKINLRIELFFVQYEKTRNLQVGVAWPATIGGDAFGTFNFAWDFLTKSTTTATAALVDQPLPGLDMATRNGWVKVLKHSTLITANGVEAEYENGGAQWFPANNGLTSTIREIKFGTNLKVLPRYDPKRGEMLITVGADTTDLTPPVTSSTVLPGQVNSKLNTQVAMKLGQSLVLSGIRSSQLRHSNNGIPWLSEIPIIGHLFGSKTTEENELEGAVFVVPSVIDNVPQHSAELVRKTIEGFKDYGGEVDRLAPLDRAADAIQREGKRAN